MIFNSLHLDIRFGIYILYFNIYTKGYLNIKSLDNNFFFFLRNVDSKIVDMVNFVLIFHIQKTWT